MDVQFSDDIFLNDSKQIYDEHPSIVYYEYAMYLAGSIGDFLIIVCILKHETRRRLHDTILAWAILDFFSLIMAPSYLTERPIEEYFVYKRAARCFITYIDAIFEILSTVITILWTSTRFLYLHKRNYLICIVSIAMIQLFIVFIHSFTCLYNHGYPVILPLDFLLCFFLLVNVIIKDLNDAFQCRRLRHGDEKVQRNILRIYVYTWMICTIPFTFVYYVYHLFVIYYAIYMANCLIPIYIFIYLMRNDRDLALIFKNLMRCRCRNEDTVMMLHNEYVDVELTPK